MARRKRYSKRVFAYIRVSSIGIVMEIRNNDRLLRNCKRLMEKKARRDSHLQFLEKRSSNNIIPKDLDWNGKW
jgi:predicted amidohydrolase